MNKIMKCACALVAFALPVVSFADVSPNTPPAVVTIADGLLAGKALTGSTLRDCVNGQWLVGVEAPLYKQWYLSPDLGIAYPISQGNAHGLYYISGRFWAGQLLYDKVPAIKSLADSTAFTATLLQYGTVGGWGARDFDYGIWRAGIDAGLTVVFGSNGQPVGVKTAKAPSYLSRLNLYSPFHLS